VNVFVLIGDDLGGESKTTGLYCVLTLLSVEKAEAIVAVDLSRVSCVG